MEKALATGTPILLFALLATGCASVVPTAATALPAEPLLGPYAGRDAACSALVTSAGQHGWRSATCKGTHVDLGANAPLGAAIILLKDAAPTDPRLAGTGAYFLGIATESAYFLTSKSLDEVNGAAGHTYLPVVTVEAASVVTRFDGASRVVFKLRDATTSICNACEGAAHDQRTPVETRRILTVCSRIGSGKPECTPPLTVSAGTDFSLSDDTLTVSEPGKPTVTYTISF